MAVNTRQLNVSITPHFSKYIRDKVKSGGYSSASEVVREDLRRYFDYVVRRGKKRLVTEGKPSRGCEHA